jgi:hypothetical protein
MFSSTDKNISKISSRTSEKKTSSFPSPISLTSIINMNNKQGGEEAIRGFQNKQEKLK